MKVVFISLFILCVFQLQAQRKAIQFPAPTAVTKCINQTFVLGDEKGQWEAIHLQERTGLKVFGSQMPSEYYLFYDNNRRKGGPIKMKLVKNNGSSTSNGFNYLVTFIDGVTNYNFTISNTECMVEAETTDEMLECTKVYILKYVDNKPVESN